MMTQQLTTNARVLPTTLDQLRLLKKALGIKTLHETAEYVVKFASEHPAHARLLEHEQDQRDRDQQRRELQAQLLG